MKDLILIKTYPDKTEADRLRDYLLTHDIAAVIVTDSSPGLKQEGDAVAVTSFFDVKVPAVDVAKTVSLLTSSGVNPLLADDTDETAEDMKSETERELLAEVKRLQARLADMTDKYLHARTEIENLSRQHDLRS